MAKSFHQQWLEILCTQLPGAQAAIFMTPAQEGKTLSPRARWPADLEGLNDFADVVKYAMKKRGRVHLSQGNTTDGKPLDLFALPVTSQSRLLGILVVKTVGQPASHHKAIMATLVRSLNWMKLARGAPRQENDFYARVVQLLASCFEQQEYQQGLISLVSELTRSFKCDRVAFGEYRDHFSRVVALSNSAQFDERSNLMRKIADAMDEAIEQDQAMLFPDQSASMIQRDHLELSRRFGAGAICTLPLAHDGEIYGAICLLRDEEHPFDRATLSLLQQALALVTPYLALRRDEERSMLVKLGRAARNQLRRLFGLRHLKLKLASLTGLAILVAASLINIEHRVTANAVLEGSIQRVVAAPLSGYLLSASVRAGDTVQAGQVMASLNDTDIKLQLARLTGELHKARGEYREAQSSRDLVKVRVVNEQINQINAEIELTRQQLQRIHLTAPFDGVVIEGDLAQSLGAPVERGESLFKIAPLEGYRIILKVDEGDISYIQPRQSGQLILPSLSERQIPLSVEKITVAASAEDGANIFRVEASPAADVNELLRPGMQGIAKISAGHASAIWVWTHDIIDWLRLWLWSWWP